MISIDNLKVEFGVKPLFDNVSFVINDKDRIALVGKNGAGKSTMLKIICGLQKPTSGNVAIPNDTTIGYLPQVMNLQDDTTVREETQKAFADISRMKERVDRLNAELAERTDYESESYMELVQKFTAEHERYMMMGAENYEAEIERTLTGLGFVRSDFDRPTSEFSGGWRMRIELAKILLRRPDVLLLDEPTNHLDIESIQWLERFLQQSARAVVLVSHDRAFINNVTNRTLEITCGHVTDYKVKYDEYVTLRAERREQQIRAYENQQKEIADIKDFIERFRYKPTKAVQVQSRIKQLEKIVPIEIDEIDNSALHLKFPPCLRSGDYPVICEDVEKKYGDHNVQIGYFAQNQAQMLDGELTVFETIDNVARGEVRLKINDILGAFMFGGEASDKKVKVLSGGERSRLAMIRLLLEPVNLLILDEPTNHLDMPSKDVLKEAIKAFDGTAIVVSHDREFLDGLVTKVYEFGGGKVTEHLGGIYDYLRAHNATSIDEHLGTLAQQTSQPSSTDKAAPAADDAASSSKASYAERKELQKKIRKAERAVSESEDKISKMETRLKELDTLLCDPDHASDMTLINEYTETKNTLDKEEEKWEELSEELETLMQQLD